MSARTPLFLALALVFCGSLMAQPPNDDCTSPQPINPGQLGLISTVGATASAANLNGCPNFVEDVWFSVTPTQNGLLEVFHDANPDQHAVYLSPGPGMCPTDADQLYCDSPSNQNSSLTPAVAGETYLIRIGSWQGGTTQPGNLLHVNLLAAPANDDCSDPELISSIPATVPYDTDGGNPSVGLTGCQFMRDVWFEFMATATGIYSVDANAGGGAFGVDVAAYESAGPGLCPMDSNNVSCTGASSMSFNGTAGISYLLRVGVPFGNGFVAGDMSVSYSPGPPANDDCLTPTVLALPSTTPFDTAGATPDASGLACNLNDDVWFAVTPPANGQVRVAVNGTFQRHELFQVPLGTCPTDADSVSACWSTNETYTTVMGGLNYLIRLGQQNSGPISGTIEVEYVAHPANDDCLSPTVVPIPSTDFPISTVGATPTAGFGCTNHADTFYTFTAPSTGTLFVGFDDFVHRGLYEYDGVNCPTVQIDCDGGNFAYWSVTAGQQYMLWISFLNQFPPVDTTMDIQMVTFATNDDCGFGQPFTLAVPTTVPVVWDNIGGTDDTAGLSCDIGKDLWYDFTAPFDGNLFFTQQTLEPFAIYHDQFATGVCPTNADQLDCGSFPNSSFISEFVVQSGERYLIRVGGSGFSGAPTSGEFTLEYILGDPVVTCDASVPGQITANYTIPVGSSYDVGVDVFINGVYVETIPQTQTSYLVPLAPMFGGVISVGFVGVNTNLGMSDLVECAVAIGGPSYDSCNTPLAIGAGDTGFDNTVTILEPGVPLSTCAQNTNADRDVWFSFTSTSTELFTASTCTTPFFHTMEVYEGNGCPSSMASPIDCAGIFDCAVSFFATTGETYMIRVTGANSGYGPGSLSLVADCSPLTGLSAIYDCAANTVSLNWVGGLHIGYDVVSDLGANLSLNQPSAGFVINGPTPGYRTYTVTGHCPNGAALSASVDVYIADLSSPGQDLILAMEGVLDNGQVGTIDSAAALEEALTLTLGRTVSILSVEDFDLFPCLTTLTDTAEIIWVLGGTFPFNYTLSVAERDLLANLNALGTPIYFESANQWSFAPPSLLDLRDGIEPDDPGDNILAGDDSFTSMTGQFSGLAEGDFTGFGTVAYNQDAPGNDGTDQLIVSGTDMTGTYPPDFEINAGAIWTNHDDTMTGEPAYVTGVHAIHVNDGGRMISTTFEFGGFNGDRGALAQAYVEALTGAGPMLEEFVRGDVNGDGANNIADAIYLLGNLFPIGAANILNCLEAADGNNDGSINIADAVAILGSLFGNPAVPLNAPYPNCGDETDSPNQTGIGCDIGTCP